MAHVMRRTKASILRAYAAADGQPIIVVSHSGGGIATRLAMSRTLSRVSAVASPKRLGAW